MTVGIAGNGWKSSAKRFPRSWTFTGAFEGRSYGNFLRSGKICIAPLTPQVSIDGIVHPGDQDTARTYELAAAHCFFLHQRTEYVESLYDERTEVPLWDGPEELWELISKFVQDEFERLRFASAAHRRAVPNYSIAARARQISQIIRSNLLTA